MTVPENVDARFELGFLGAVVLWCLYMITDMVTFDDFLAWFLPAITVVGMGAFIAVRCYSLLVAGTVYQPEDDDTKTFDRRATTSGIVVSLSLILGYMLLAWLIGFFFAMPIFLVAFFYVYDLYPPARLAVVTLIVWLGTSFLFGTVFGIPGLDLGPFSALDLGLF